VEGGVTVLWAVASGVLLPDFPGNWKRFDDREKVVGVGRIRKAGVVGFGEGRKIGRWEAVGGALRDWRVWLITFGVGVSFSFSAMDLYLWEMLLLTVCLAVGVLDGVGLLLPYSHQGYGVQFYKVGSAAHDTHLGSGGGMCARQWCHC